MSHLQYQGREHAVAMAKAANAQKKIDDERKRAALAADASKPAAYERDRVADVTSSAQKDFDREHAAEEKRLADAREKGLRRG